MNRIGTFLHKESYYQSATFFIRCNLVTVINFGDYILASETSISLIAVEVRMILVEFSLLKFVSLISNSLTQNSYLSSLEFPLNVE